MNRRPSSKLLHVTLVAAGAFALSACSVESIVERFIGQAEGIDEVSIDAEEGSFSIGGEEGEFGVEVGEDGSTSFSGEDGEFTTGPTDEVPADILDAVSSVPDSFVPVSISETRSDEGSGRMLQGEVSGDREQLLDELEAGISAAGWAEVERVAYGPGFGAVVGTEGEGGSQGVQASVILDEESGEGTLQILLTEDLSELDTVD